MDVDQIPGGVYYTRTSTKGDNSQDEEAIVDIEAVRLTDPKGNSNDGSDNGYSEKKEDAPLDLRLGEAIASDVKEGFTINAFS